MIKLSYFVVLAAVCAMFYNFGYTAAQMQYMEKENVILDATTRAYNARIEELNQVNKDLNVQIKAYANDNRALDERANALRLQLSKALNSKPPSCTLDRSESTREFSSGWRGKMDKIVRGATDLVVERDRIALAYNKLREQCLLK